MPIPACCVRQKGQGKEVKLAQQEDPSRFAASKLQTTQERIGYKNLLTLEAACAYYELSYFSEIGENDERRLVRGQAGLRRGLLLTMETKQPAAGCCGVEAVVTVDARGQIVLPKELRDAAHIGTGDKLAVVSLKNDGRLCCLALMKVEELAGTVREILNPVASRLLKE